MATNLLNSPEMRAKAAATRAAKGKLPSLRKCINDKCRDCIYDEKAGGTWRQQVTVCTSTLCPLYPVRPVSKGKLPANVGQ